MRELRHRVAETTLDARAEVLREDARAVEAPAVSSSNAGNDNRSE